MHAFISRRRALHSALLTSLLLLTANASPSDSEAAVWKTTQQWSTNWETAYSDWVKNNWDTDFFSRKNTPYTNLKVDCADTVYSMRAIFAFENGLPFVIKDPTGGQTPISNEMIRFDKLPTQGHKRIRAFLNYIYGIAGTSSLPADTYPVKPDRTGIKPGGLLLTDKLSHHSWTIKDITPEGLPHLIFSSRPAKTTILSRLGFPTMGFVFPKGVDESRHAGFRAFRQPEDIGKPVWELEDYSREQYEIPANDWRETIQKKLATREESPEQKIQRLFEDACTNARERLVAVQEGLNFLSKYEGQCLDPKSFDDFSTPNRDLRLKGSFEDLDLALQEQRNRGQIPDPAEFRCSISIAPGKELTFQEIREASLSDKLSSNPHDPIEIRWGQTLGPGPRAAQCPVY